MADYEPTSRRPIADLFRLTAHGSVRLCVRLGVHPDLVSYASVVMSAGAGICFWQAKSMPRVHQSCYSVNIPIVRVLFTPSVPTG